MLAGARRFYESCDLGTRFHNYFRTKTCPFSEIAKRIPASGEVLDLGCGNGLFSNYLASTFAGLKVTGIDISEKKIHMARRGAGSRPNARFLVGDLSSSNYLDDRSESFDAILLIDSLYLLPFKRQRDLITECHGYLRNGGTLIVKTLDTKPLWKHYYSMLQDCISIHIFRMHFSLTRHVLNPLQLRELLVEAGFTVVEQVDLSKRYMHPHLLYVCQKKI